MSDKKISQLDPTTSVSGSDLIVIVTVNGTRKISVNDFFMQGGGIAGSIRLQGSWDASTNTPDISTTTIVGYAWRISVDGNTNIGGVIDWNVGDLAVKTDNGWIKIGNKDIEVQWKNIKGNISDSTELQGAFDLKADLVNGIVPEIQLPEFVKSIECTYAELQLYISNANLRPNRWYHITDRDFYLQALTVNSLKMDGYRKMLIPSCSYYPQQFGSNVYRGVWHPDLIIGVNEYVIWGGLIWKNITGNIGSSNDYKTLDTTNWEVLSKENYINEYRVKIFKINFDYINNILLNQSDEYNNVVKNNSSDSVYIDISDWGSANENIRENISKGFFNNKIDGDGYNQGSSCLMICNDVESFISNNYYSNSSKICYNKAYSIINNKLAGSGGGQIVNNTQIGYYSLIGIENNNLDTASYIVDNIFSESIENNLLNSGSYISQNKVTTINDNVINSSAISKNTTAKIEKNTLDANGVIKDNIVTTSISKNIVSSSFLINNSAINISTNSLTNSSQIEFNTVTDDISTNTLNNTSKINKNISNGITSNQLNNSSEISTNKTNGEITTNQLNYGGYISDNISMGYIKGNIVHDTAYIIKNIVDNLELNTVYSSGYIQLNEVSSDIKSNTVYSGSSIQLNKVSGTISSNTVYSSGKIINNIVKSLIDSNIVHDGSSIQYNNIDSEISKNQIYGGSKIGNNTTIEISENIISNGCFLEFNYVKNIIHSNTISEGAYIQYNDVSLDIKNNTINTSFIKYNIVVGSINGINLNNVDGIENKKILTTSQNISELGLSTDETHLTNLNVHNTTITNLANGTNPTDAVNKSQLDSKSETVSNGLSKNNLEIQLGGSLTQNTAILGGGMGGKTLSLGDDTEPLMSLNVKTNSGVTLKTGSILALSGNDVQIKANEAFVAFETTNLVPVTRIKGSESSLIQLDNDNILINVDDYNGLILKRGVLDIHIKNNSKTSRFLSNNSKNSYEFNGINAIIQTEDKTTFSVINEYDGDLSAKYTDRTLVDKGYVTAAINAVISSNDAMIYKGVIDASSNPNYPAASTGHFYKISVVGKIGGASGKTVEVGDSLLCTTDNTPSGDQATVGTNWNIIQANIDGAVVSTDTTSVADNLVTEAGTTGKTIKDSGITKSSVQTAITNSHTHSNKSTLDTINQGVATSDSPTFAGITDTGLSANQIVQTDTNKKLQTVAPSSGFNQAFETNPSNLKMDGTASVGTSNNIPRVDHVHPSDTTKVDKANNGTDFANRQTTINNLTNAANAQSYQVLKAISNVAQFVDNKVPIAGFSVVSGKQCWNQDYLWSGYTYQESIKSGNDSGWNNSANGIYANPELVTQNATIKEITLRLSRACVSTADKASIINLNLRLVKMKSDGFISKTDIIIPINITTNIMTNNSMGNTYADLLITNVLNIPVLKGDLLAMQFNSQTGNSNIVAMDGVKISLSGVVTE